ncbi:MAG: hypothetical protein NZ898_15050, partial [Myxococcota bacterium]|nr:hypothetical protein [Myxococcota bacterium]
TGMLALLFVVFHLAHVWWPKLAGWGAARAYDTLRERLAEPAVALLYVVGLTATCAHAAQGLAVAALRTGWLRGSGGRIAAYGTTSVLAALGWIVAMQAVAHLATGATLGPAFLAGAGLGAPRP